jgi:hypothetical protein
MPRGSGSVRVELAAVVPSTTSAPRSPEGCRVGDVSAAVVVATGQPEPGIAFAWYLDGAPIEVETADTCRAPPRGFSPPK